MFRNIILNDREILERLRTSRVSEFENHDKPVCGSILLVLTSDDYAIATGELKTEFMFYQIPPKSKNVCEGFLNRIKDFCKRMGYDGVYEIYA